MEHSISSGLLPQESTYVLCNKCVLSFQVRKTVRHIRHTSLRLQIRLKTSTSLHVLKLHQPSQQFKKLPILPVRHGVKNPVRVSVTCERY